jgi:hypothetical protein
MYRIAAKMWVANAPKKEKPSNIEDLFTDEKRCLKCYETRQRRTKKNAPKITGPASKGNVEGSKLPRLSAGAASLPFAELV